LQDKLREFQPIFYPKSVAVVGTSRDERRGGTQFMKALLKAGYGGNIYPINPNADEIGGLKAFPSISSIPDEVDYVIVAVPKHLVLGVLDDCITKRVKTVHIFTAGFREIGEDEWALVEKEITKKAHQGGFRIIGPNCIGICSPWINIPLGPGDWTLPEAGSVGIVCQSGGLAREILETGIARKIKFSNMVSFGNACDLESIDFLEYLAVDPKTKVIGAYLENVNDGERFLKIAQEITATKPFVVWKGGRTQAGARVAASHTGALAASDIIWNSVLRQVNAVKVEDIDEMSDYILAFQDLPELLRGDIALITGLADGGGGDSVVSTDICTALGLQIPALLDKTVEGLKSIEGIVTNILSNPVDLNLGAADKEVVWKAMDLITNDPNVAIIIVQEHMASVLTYRTREAAQEMNEIFLEFARRRDKPIILVLKPGLAESMRAETEETFRQAGIPVFPSLMRAAKAVAALIRFYSSHKARHG